MQIDESIDLDRFSLYDRIAEEDPFPYSESLHDDFLAQFHDEDIRGALLSIPQVYRVPLVLLYTEELSYRELAGAAGLSGRHGDVPLAPRAEGRRARAVAMGETSGVGEGVDAMTRMNCEEAIRQFFVYLDRALSGEPLEALEAHLQDCLDCCDRLQFTRRLDSAVKARLAEGGVPEGVEDRLRGRLAKLGLEAAES